MKVSLQLFGFLLLLLGCEQRDVLVNNNWNLIRGTIHGKPIEFHRSDQLFFTDQDGHVIRWLDFGKDETIILPGINSPNIRARWTTKGNEIRFSIDSMRYSIGTFDASIFEPGDSTENTGITDNLREFEEPMRIYGQVFRYSISRDTLRILSKDVKFWAVRDRRIDDMFKNL